ncbi:putative quinol monooxygenase [Chryseolinea lacunae]|uniref:Antibiotic biosynthesis monooxygenase n=1 Tax=Chryseolinea lacunae TaxID=2801331 RepID=A0ABS1KU70_9BACT|nr:putative quinol monooxygenase [Chryseolinea lacunae]MBL0743009.1 antibiotic biosynthesis monooxygenase [Chryseolinea lacunae]
MSKKTIHVFTKWQVKEGQMNALLSLFVEVVRRSIEEPGNLYYKVHQSKTDPNTLLIFEGYIDEAAFAEHLQLEHAQNLVEGEISALLKEREVIVGTQLMFALPGVPLRQRVPVL